MKNLYKLLLLVILCTTLKLRAQVPLFNSYPSAAATIYLDFDGQYLNGTAWNTNGPMVLGPSNLNASQMEEVFNRVAEDYRPFNINVTTDSAKYWAAPADKRMRIIFTVTSDWYGAAGGVSYMGSFTWGDNTPAFVFSALLNYKTKNIAEAASHEAGHTLGLRHQSRYDANCIKKEEYNTGDGSGEIGWAPIMGVGYYRNLTTWHNGPNPYGCNSEQDDLAIITSTDNGFGYRPVTKTAGSFASAISIVPQNNALAAAGTIITNTDNDYYKLSLSTGGAVKINIRPYSVAPGDNGSNLDVQVKLYSSKQNLVATYNPPALLSASIDTTLNAGNYYLVVGGAANAYASSYASLGNYSIEGSLNSLVVLPIHKLELKGRNSGGTHQLGWTFEANETILRQSLEVSVNGIDYQDMAQLSAEAREYAYAPMNGTTLYYRLHVTLESGEGYFSNVIAIANEKTRRPALAGNIVRTSLSINSPDLFNYEISDYNGRLLGKGKLVQGMNLISSSGLTNGLYLIRFSYGAVVHTEKFMKQ